MPLVSEDAGRARHEALVTGSGTVLVVLLLAGIASTPAAALVPYVAVLGALCAALVLERRPGALLSLVLWVWLLAPFLRRVVDASVGYTQNSVVLLAPVAVVLPGALSALLAPTRPVQRHVAVALGSALLVLGYALPVGVVQNGPAAAVAGAVNWLPPVLLALWVVVRGPGADNLRAGLTVTARAALLLVSVYGLVQWFVLPPWDEQWIRGAGLVSVGFPEPREFRVFSTLNSQGPCASVLGVLLLVVGGTATRPRHLLLLLPGFAAFLLTLVRSAWVGFALAVLVGLVLGAIRVRAVLAAGLAVALFLLLGGPAAAAVQDRFSSTAEQGSQDTSAAARLRFAAYAVPEVLTRVTGAGLGAAGTASRLQTVAAREDPLRQSDLDSGFIETALTVGSVGGAAFLGSLLVAIAALARRARGDAVAAAWVLAAVSCAGQLLLGNPFVSVSGIVLWLSVAVAARLVLERRQVDGGVDRPPPDVRDASTASA